MYGTLFSIMRLKGFQRAYAGITLPNAASVGFHESFGFTAVGMYERVGYKLGAWPDVGYWQLLVQTNDGAPALPWPLPDLLDNQGLQQELQTGSEKLAHDLAEVSKALDA